MELCESFPFLFSIFPVPNLGYATSNIPRISRHLLVDAKIWTTNCWRNQLCKLIIWLSLRPHTNVHDKGLGSVYINFIIFNCLLPIEINSSGKESAKEDKIHFAHTVWFNIDTVVSVLSWGLLRRIRQGSCLMSGWMRSLYILLDDGRLSKMIWRSFFIESLVLFSDIIWGLPSFSIIANITLVIYSLLWFPSWCLVRRSTFESSSESIYSSKRVGWGHDWEVWP